MRMFLLKAMPLVAIMLGFSTLPSTQVNALVVFTCPDGSVPPNGVCPTSNPPKISCANVRCKADSRCIETYNGPQCVPLTPPNTNCPYGQKFDFATYRCQYSYQYYYPYPQPTYQWPAYPHYYQPHYNNYYWPRYRQQYRQQYQRPRYRYHYQNW